MNTPHHWQVAGPGVFRDARAVMRAGDSHIEFLTSELASSDTGRVRLCAHAGNDTPVQEMLIALTPETYVRPHRHLNKSESFHMIDGEIDIVLFSCSGEISEVIPLAPFGHSRTFYYRLSSDLFHTVLVKAPRAVFHETTGGPFIREETEFASWSPEASALEAIAPYQQSLRTRVASWKTLHQI